MSPSLRGAPALHSLNLLASTGGMNVSHAASHSTWVRWMADSKGDSMHSLYTCWAAAEGQGAEQAVQAGQVRKR